MRFSFFDPCGRYGQSYGVTVWSKSTVSGGQFVTVPLTIKSSVEIGTEKNEQTSNKPYSRAGDGSEDQPCKTGEQSL